MKSHTALVIIFLFFEVSLLPSQQDAIDVLRENSEAGRQLLQQQQETQRDLQYFRQAQTLINLNRYDHAIVILQDLVSRHPQNMNYYEWLLRSLLITSRLAEADSLVNFMGRRDPQNLKFTIDKARIMCRMNQADEALQLWQSILAKNSTDISIISQVANAMQESNLADEAISVYLNAMERIPNTQNFNLNIAGIYKSRIMYSEATRYYLKYLQAFPEQQTFIFNQILSLPIEPDQQSDFLRVIENMAGQKNAPPEIRLLLAQLYQRYRDFESAFRIYQALEQEKSDFARLLAFAQAAQRDSSYQVALQAFRFIINRYPNSPQVLAAYSGAVSALFQLALQESRDHFAREAFSLIDSLSSRFSQNPELARLLYMKGTFHLDYYFDVDRAIEIFSQIITSYRLKPQQKNEILLKIGECQMIKGDLDQAIKTLLQIKQPPTLGNAQLYLAQCHYFLKDWNSSQQMLETIVQNQGSAGEVTNDALSLQIKITQLQSQPSLLGVISESEFLVFQRKKSEALKKYLEIIQNELVPPAIKSDAYLQAARLSLDLKEPAQALEYSTQAIKDPQIILYGDRHLFMMATILQSHLNRPREAFDTYRQLLELYPQSLLADRSRDQMKILREQRGLEVP